MRARAESIDAGPEDRVPLTAWLRLALIATTAATALTATMACSGGGSAADAGAPGDAARVDGPGVLADGPAGTGEPAELAGITAAHNQVRAMITSSNALPTLVWDATLAATAAAYVQQCVDADKDGLVDHNGNRSVGHPFYVGENIFASSGTATGAAAVAAWAGEAAHYHDADNSCDAGQSCGHYTQVVWRATEKIGCALHVCAGLKYPSTIVCDYGPGGNIGNQKPY